MTVLTCIGIGVGSFLVPLPAFFRLIEADHLTPCFVRELPTTARDASRDAAVWLAALLMLLTLAAPEATR